MIMDALKGVREGTSPHTSPVKRTFDVAFLTGARDHALDTRLAPDVASPPKVSRTAEHKALSPPARASSSPAPSTPPREDAAPGSAFTKVTRSQGSPPPLPPFSAASTLDALSSAWPPASASFSAVSSLLGSTKSLAPLLAAPGLLPPGLAPFLPPAAAPDRLNNNLVEEYLKSQHQLLDAKASGAELSAGEALSRLRSSMYPADPYKLPFSSLSYPLSAPPHAEAGKLSSAAAAAAAAAPFVPQPSVSAIMPPSLTSLALSTQNVCAKCNISFRMTSDLVYHMRSQHKREPDPYKKRRNEKLKCSYCGESFRERHHLTRHMSAHQDRDEEAEPK
ncbi:PR domain zinc finger protein 8-like [Penaeus japonicus]|uniref:PR domain zinc finger protein 8-like n=1 Tax=Penaeus japonicus TaxID=27405 RepID=UPI001C71371A|nr:PR domain zinc finger protein 8-like [Penaeus japonicus]